MKPILSTFLFLLLSLTITAQVDSTKANPYDVNVSTSQVDAHFPGGSDSLMSFIWKNIIYPESAEKANISGEVQIGFDVNFDGSLINFYSISDFGYGLENELIRVLKTSPKWIPAEVNNTKFRQQFLLSFPISRYNIKE